MNIESFEAAWAREIMPPLLRLLTLLADKTGLRVMIVRELAMFLTICSIGKAGPAPLMDNRIELAMVSEHCW